MKFKLFSIVTLFSVFFIMGCPQPTDDPPGVAPEVTGFNFTATNSLQIGVNVGSGSTAGSFNTPVGGTAPFTYSLVSGEGSTDNALFVIVGTNLKVGSSALVTPKSYSVRVEITDSKSKLFSKACTFTVSPAPGEDPEITGFTFTAASGLKIGAGTVDAGDIVGSFSAPLGGTEPFTYTLATGTGDTDNTLFEINETDLKVKTNALSTAKEYSVYVQINDSKGKTYAKTCSFTVTTNEPVLKGNFAIPTITDITGKTIAVYEETAGLLTNANMQVLQDGFTRLDQKATGGAITRDNLTEIMNRGFEITFKEALINDEYVRIVDGAHYEISSACFAYPDDEVTEAIATWIQGAVSEMQYISMEPINSIDTAVLKGNFAIPIITDNTGKTVAIYEETEGLLTDTDLQVLQSAFVELGEPFWASGPYADFTKIMNRGFYLFFDKDYIYSGMRILDWNHLAIYVDVLSSNSAEIIARDIGIKVGVMVDMDAPKE
jgi:hypothetical protein